MKRKLLLITITLIFVFSTLFAIQQFTQAQAPGGSGGRSGQQGGGPPQGMMMTMQILPLEGTWTQISFELGVSDDALIKARKVFQDTWTKRKAIMAKAESAGNDEDARRTLRTDLEKLKTDLNTKLKAILTPKQMEDIAKWEKENQNRFRSRQQSGSGGGQQRPQR